MGGRGDDRFRAAAVGDFYLVGGALFADDFTGLPVKSRVESAVGDAGVDGEMDFLSGVEILDGSVWWGCSPVAGVVAEFLPGPRPGSMGVWHTE